MCRSKHILELKSLILKRSVENSSNVEKSSNVENCSNGPILAYNLFSGEFQTKPPVKICFDLLPRGDSMIFKKMKKSWDSNSQLAETMRYR